MLAPRDAWTIPSRAVVSGTVMATEIDPSVPSGAPDPHGGIDAVSPDETLIWSLDPVADLVVCWPHGEAIAAEDWRAAVHPADRDRLAAAMQEVYAVGHAELTYRRSNDRGELRWLHESLQRCDDDGALRILGFGRDITAFARIEADAALMQAIVATVSEGLIVFDPTGQCLVFNPQVQAITGYSREDAESSGMFRRMFPARNLRVQAVVTWHRAWRGEDLVNQEWRIVRRDGAVRDVLVSTRILGEDRQLLMAVRDVTAKRRAEDERWAVERRLREAERLESLGVMAGGIAHDFNNLLQAILGYTELAAATISENTPAAAALDEVRRAGLRAADLTRQMLAYAGRTRFVPQRVDLSRVVVRARSLLAASLASNHRLELDVADDLPSVDADPAQLRQVLINLVANAAEALSDHGGQVILRTGVRVCDAEYLARCYPADALVPGKYAWIEVEDDGCGMSVAVQARVFDPFFSTKFTGRGLGLAAVLGIVRSHRGALAVTSQPQRGTTIRVLLPVAMIAAAEVPCTVADR